MGRETLVELLIATTLRPHRSCLYRASACHQQAIRFASTNSSRPNRETPKPVASRDKTPPSSRIPPAARVPLHVGLDRNPENVSAISRIPIPQGVKGEQFTPSVLARPLGLPYPPRAGQNSPVDHRSFSEKKKEFSDYDKVLERRKVYLRSFFRPYFQEWKRFDHHKGKSFVSNDRLFKRDKALYFPNIWGQTLSMDGDGPDGGRDSTPVLMDKVSVVAVRSNQWANEQVDTFIGPEKNPELQNILEENGTQAQRVDINIQGDWMRLLLVRLFKNGLRKEIPEDRWNRYFMVKLPRDVRKGLTDDIRDAMGLLNSQVGYVYLVDRECRIRWAGSGHAWKGEVEGLNAAIRRLLQEASETSAQPRTSTITRKPQPGSEIAPKTQTPVAMPA